MAEEVAADNEITEVNAAGAVIEDWGSVWHGRHRLTARSTTDVSEGMWWPAGQHIVEASRLKQLLARSGRWHARHAIALYVSEDLDELLQAAVSTGTAVELMAKALCASVSQSLLADKGDRDSLLMLAGQSSRSSKSPTQMRSVMANELLKTVRYLEPSLAIPGDDALSLRVRNAAIHMALVAAPELRKAVIEMAKFVDGAVPLLGLDKDKYWGHGAEEVVRTLLDEAQTETDRVVQAKLAAAQTRFDALKATVPGSQLSGVLVALSATSVSLVADEQSHECPVCPCDGILKCSVERGEIEYYQDEDGASASVKQTAYPEAFKCPACRLELSGDEMDGFDFPDVIELREDLDPHEMYDYEPPDDDWRRDEW